MLRYVAAVLACVMGSAAHAADPARPLLWSGPYAGVHVGAGWQSADTGYSTASNGPFPFLFDDALADGAIPTRSSQDGSGFVGGAALGYNVQSGAFVYGVEIDATWLDLRESSATTTHIGNNPVLETRTTTETEWLATLRGRAGILVSPQTLLFATGGLAVGRVKGSTSITPEPCDNNAYCSSGSGSDTRWGWTIGGGVEHAIGGSWTLKLEYLYYDLGSFSYTANEISPAFPAIQGMPNAKVETDVTGQILRAGVNFRF